MLFSVNQNKNEGAAVLVMGGVVSGHYNNVRECVPDVDILKPEPFLAMLGGS